MKNAMVEAALRYAEHGWPVFPCEPRGKRPITRNGLRDASTDRERIQAWWRGDGLANVAVRTGRESGIVVLDVDGDPGSESLYLLEREHDELPPTASVQTPSGGCHFYFKHPGVEVRNSAAALGNGLDVRGDGGYVLAPPSVGANLRRYEPDERARLADLPAWLLERLVQPAADGPRVPTSEWLRIVRDGLTEGERNHGLARLTGHLLRRYVDVDLAAELVHLVNARCRPPLPSPEVDRIVESIAGRELQRRTRSVA